MLGRGEVLVSGLEALTHSLRLVFHTETPPGSASLTGGSRVDVGPSQSDEQGDRALRIEDQQQILPASPKCSHLGKPHVIGLSSALKGT